MSLAIDKIGFLFWLNVSFDVNHGWTLRSTIDIYFVYSHRNTDIFCESQWCPCLQSRSPLGTHMRVSVLHSQAVGHPICDPGRIIAAPQRDDLIVLWTHYFSENVFTSSPTCFAGKKSIAIHLITMKDRFFQHQQESTICLVVIRWLRNDASIPRAPKICRIRYSSQVTDLTVGLQWHRTVGGNELVL